MGDESKIRDAADAVKGVLESPVIHEATYPAAQQVGKALETVGKAVNVALAPVGALVWGFDRIRDWLVPTLEAKLASTPPERIVTPPALIAGPVMEALRYAAGEPSIRDLYANLLATAMDSETAHTAHPAFVEILRQLSPDEARLVGYIAGAPAQELAYVNVSMAREHGPGKAALLVNFSVLATSAGCAFADLTASYLDNLQRLGIVRMTNGTFWIGEEADAEYARLIEHARVRDLVTQVEEEGHSAAIDKGAIEITTLGRQFIAACIDRGASTDAVSEPATPT